MALAADAPLAERQWRWLEPTLKTVKYGRFGTGTQMQFLKEKGRFFYFPIYITEDKV
jgi:hypothetical protein